MTFKGTRATLADLDALSVDLENDGTPVFVLNPLGDGSVPPGIYLFRAGSTLSVMDGLIYNPTHWTGRWVRMGDLMFKSTVAPSGAPLLVGIEWVASLSNPARTIIWKSVGTLAATDWIPVTSTPLAYEGDPTGVFTPDYERQLVFNTVANQLFVADGLTSNDWVLAGGSSGGY